MLLGAFGFLISCSSGDSGSGTAGDGGSTDDGGNEGDDSNDGSDDSDDTDNSGSSPSANAAIIVPEYKDYQRGTVSFSSLSYSRPGFAKIIAAFDDASEAIDGGTLSAEEELELIRELEDDFELVQDMNALSFIYYSKNSLDDFWLAEYEYNTKNYAAFAKAVEQLYVSAANSKNKGYLEENYFGVSLDEYVSGGIYTDEVVAILGEEAELEAEYAALSPDTVEIIYKDETLPASEMKEKYGTSLSVSTLIDELYSAERTSRAKEIYINLLKVRSRLATELGYDSYLEFAYETSLTEYTYADMTDLFANVKSYAVPVLESLSSYGLFNYINSTSSPSLSHISVANRLYYTYQSLDAELFDIYSYMLQHGLYEFSTNSQDGFTSSYTTYIPGNNSPFLYISTTDTIKDYLTVAHEFGHFTDAYVNGGLADSVDVAELYSQSLELLTLAHIDNYLTANNYTCIRSYATANVLGTLLTQSFFSLFEHKAYELAYDDISEESLNNLANEAYFYFYGTELDSDYAFSQVFTQLLQLQIVDYPFYVQSYCTSLIGALQVFFAEIDDDSSRSGIEIYKELLDRSDAPDELVPLLASAGLMSPFDSEAMLYVANSIHEYIRGEEFFKHPEDGTNRV